MLGTEVRFVIDSTPSSSRDRPLPATTIWSPLAFALCAPLLGGCMVAQRANPGPADPRTELVNARIAPAQTTRDAAPPSTPLLAMPRLAGPSFSTPFHLARPMTAQPELVLGHDRSVPKDNSLARVANQVGPTPSDPTRSQTDGSGSNVAEISELSGSPAAETPESIPQATGSQAIDLPSALRLADKVNPTIGEARVVILEALARRQSAYALLLPTLNAGTNYHDHIGVLQRSNGTILPVNEQSLYFGGGARALAAESVGIPAVNIFSPLTDAIFEPLAAQQQIRARQANASFVANTTLLEVARIYLRLVGTHAVFQARRAIAADADEIATDVISFAANGQGRRSDAQRANTDRRLFQTDILRAEENLAVTSALLSERLNLDPSSRLLPLNLAVEPIQLIDPNTPVEPLLQTALAGRPDLETRRALVSEAEFQVRKEKARPFLPTVWISFSGGAFGGGSNLVPPTFSAVAGRTDFDARAYWTVLNFGAGNAALIKQRRAQAGQASFDQARTVNTIRSEVSAALARTKALNNKVIVARFRLLTAEDGFKQDRSRLRETLAKPIEALDSLRLLSEARVALIEAITEYNQNQFELFVALGAPPPL